MKLTWYHKETKNTRTSSEEKAAELLCDGWIEGKYEDPIKKLESNVGTRVGLIIENMMQHNF